MRWLDTRTDGELLSAKLLLALDIRHAQTGSSTTYTDIRLFLSEKGAAISKKRWSEIIAGSSSHHLPRAQVIALAEFFGIDCEYFLNRDAAPPDDWYGSFQHVAMVRLAQLEQQILHSMRDLHPIAAQAAILAMRQGWHHAYQDRRPLDEALLLSEPLHR